MPLPDLPAVATLSTLASTTDRLAQAPVSRYEQAVGYTVCRTPERPGYVFGNYLILDQPPDLSAVPGWLDQARAAFPVESGVHALAVQWEQPGRYPVSELPDASLIEHLVLAAEDPTAADLPPAGLTDPEPADPRFADMQFAEVESGGQWDAVTEFAARETAEDPAWTRWRYAQYRALGPDACHWLVATGGGGVLASGGIVTEGRLDRFQEVVTAADRRRGGLATALCARLLRLTRRPGRVAVAVADAATGADGLYRKLGLQLVGYQYTVMATDIGARSTCDA